jgi:hypothetical protein
LVIILINRLINFYSAMNTTPVTTKGEQAKSQLIAAAIAQFGEYGLHATTRDIAAQAGQNIAAILLFWLQGRSLSRLRPVDCRFYRPQFSSARRSGGNAAGDTFAG